MTRRGGPSGLRGSKLDPYKPAIDRIVAADAELRRPRSARAIRAELGITEVSEDTVWAYVRSRRLALREAAR